MERQQGRPSLPDDAVERVRTAIEELIDLEKQNGVRGAIARAAARLGITGPALSQIRSGKNKPSYATAEAVAKALGRDPQVLLSGTPAPERWVERPVRYENLRKVVTSLRGQRHDQFLDEVLVSAALYSPTDLPEGTWQALLDGLYARWRGKAVPERERPDDDDDPIAASMEAARKKHAKRKSRG